MSSGMAGRACLRLVTFDVTNTIIRVRGSPGRWYAQAAASVGLQAEAVRLDAVQGQVRRTMTAQYPHYGYAQGMTPKEWWTELSSRVFMSAGYLTEAAVYDQIGDRLYDLFTGASCFETIPGSHDMLQDLRQLGLRLGVISNFDERLEGVLEGHGLLHHFDFLVTSVTSHCDKPDPRIFLDALREGSVSAREAAHVGDNVAKDYWGAKKVGLTAFLFDPRQKLQELEGVDRSCIFHEHKDLVQLVNEIQPR